MRSFVRGSLVVVCVGLIAGGVYARMDRGGGVSLEKLFAGNKLFVEGKQASKDLGKERRKELVKGQHPVATVLTCSDSRVAPEYIFSQGLGDIFVVRVAGNVVEPTTLGSIEYAVEHLHTPVLVIMGHSQCGAVKAAVEATGVPEGNIGAILKKIMPAAETAKKEGKGKEETLDIAIHENIKNTYKDIMANSKIISEHVHEGKLKVVGAEYYLGKGAAEVIDLNSSWKPHAHD